MTYTQNTIDYVFKKHQGQCQICGTKLVKKNYAQFGATGNWEMHHSQQEIEKGSDYIHTLLPACIVCNLEMQRSIWATEQQRSGRSPAANSKRE